MKKINLYLLFAAATIWAQPRLISTTSDRVQIRLDVPSEINILQSHGEINLPAFYPGAFTAGKPGAPALPRYRIVLGVPPEGEVNFSYSFGASRELRGVRLSAYESPGIGPEPDPELRWADTLEPVTFYLTRWRGCRVAIIEVTPLRYDYTRRHLVLYDGVNLNVTFEEPRDTRPAPRRNDPAERIYARNILNYEQSKDWRLAPQPVAPNPFGESTNWIKVTIAKDGAYRIRYRDLKKAGIDPKKIAPRTLRLLYPGERDFADPMPDTLAELPVYVHGEDDGTFDRQDYVVFFARGANRWQFAERSVEVNPFVRENVYWLTWGRSEGSRIRTRPVHPLSDDPEDALSTAQVVLHFEEDHKCPGRSGFLWLWEEIDDTATFTLDLAGMVSIDTFTSRTYTTTEQTGFSLSVGDDTFYRIEVAGKGTNPPYYTVVSPDIVIEKELSLRVETFGAGQQKLYPDWIRVVGERELTFKHGEFWVEMDGQGTYALSGLKSAPFLFDISNPADPVIMTDWQLDHGKLTMSPRIASRIPVWITEERKLPTPGLEKAEPGALWEENWDADYLVVSTSENFEAAQAFAAYRAENLQVTGVSAPKTAAIDLADIVRDFGYGLAEPQAVRHFLSYAYSKSGGRAFYVLILGDGTYDYKNNLEFSSRPEYFPIYTSGYVIDPNVYQSQAAAREIWFGDFDEDGSIMPEVVIGRITARDLREAYAALDKVKAYESEPFGEWSARVLLLADDDYEGTPSKPDGINHIPINENIAKNYLYPEFEPVKVYLSSYTLVGGQKPDAKAALIDAINLGELLWIFFGHGNGSQLTHEEVFLNTDVPRLHNGNKLPLALLYSCGVGRFEDTRWECVAEELVRHERGGSIASIAATKGTGPGDNETLSVHLLEAFRDFKHANIGDLFYNMRLSDSVYRSLYVLLGDPGVPMLFPTALSLSDEADTFVTGDTAEITFQPPSSSTQWFSTARGDWRRETSELRGTSYFSSGELLYRAAGGVDAGEQTLRFIVPAGINQGDSAYWRVVCADQDSIYTYQIDGIEVDSALLTIADYQGPSVRFLADGAEITDGDTLPPSFTLTVELEDPSGINLTGLAGWEGDSLSLVINDEVISLANYFSYEITGGELATKGAADIPLNLTSEENILTVHAVDNLLNSEDYELTIYTSFVRQLEIADPLVYPNPVSSAAEFTFDLNAASRVSVQIFTVSGRLVRRLASVSYPAGFGACFWDGLDADARSLPNGVYIYRLSAESEDAWLPNARTAVTGKFIVVH
jgi:hypothetical protein